MCNAFYLDLYCSHVILKCVGFNVANRYQAPGTMFDKIPRR
jgi:hypothetical protein